MLDCRTSLEKIKRGERTENSSWIRQAFSWISSECYTGARSVDNVGRFSCEDTLSAAPLRLLKVTRQALTFAETNPKEMSERERLSM